jgi:hypothetical protein
VTHPLVDIRHHQHNGETDWLSVAQEAIVQVLRRQDTVHANDLYELGIPDEACNVAGSAFASYLGKGWIVSTEKRRASTRPSRNCAKSFIYRATSKFPRAIGLAADEGSKPCPSPVCVSGQSGGSDSPEDRPNEGADASQESSAASGESTARLFELSPERPLSAVTGNPASQRKAA